MSLPHRPKFSACGWERANQPPPLTAACPAESLLRSQLTGTVPSGTPGTGSVASRAPRGLRGCESSGSTTSPRCSGARPARRTPATMPRYWVFPSRHLLKNAPEQPVQQELEPSRWPIECQCNCGVVHGFIPGTSATPTARPLHSLLVEHHTAPPAPVGRPDGGPCAPLRSAGPGRSRRAAASGKYCLSPEPGDGNALGGVRGRVYLPAFRDRAPQGTPKGRRSRAAVRPAHWGARAKAGTPAFSKRSRFAAAGP